MEVDLYGCKTLQNRTKKLIRQGYGLGVKTSNPNLHNLICIISNDVRCTIQHHLRNGNYRIRSNEKLHEQQFIMVTGKGILYNVIFFFIQSKNYDFPIPNPLVCSYLYHIQSKGDIL